MTEFASGALVVSAGISIMIMLFVAAYFAAELIKDRRAAREGKLALRRIAREVVSKRG